MSSVLERALKSWYNSCMPKGKPKTGFRQTLIFGYFKLWSLILIDERLHSGGFCCFVGEGLFVLFG